jgi:CheY-like chemotaxis protein
MDGLEATARIRQSEHGTGRRVPIIALTAHAMKGDRERFLAAGMDGHVTKPIRADELRRASAECLLGAARGAGCTVPTERPGAAVAPAASALCTSEGSLLDRLDGDVELLEDILGLFTEDCDRQMGLLREAVRQEDAPRAGRIAHALRGALLNLGAGAAARAAWALEDLGRRADPTGLEAACAAFDLEIARLREAIAELKGRLPRASCP